MNAKTIGRWVVYERRETEFIHLSKPFRTKGQAEKERARLKARPEYRKSAIGVGFVRSAQSDAIPKRTSRLLSVVQLQLKFLCGYLLDQGIALKSRSQEETRGRPRRSDSEVVLAKKLTFSLGLLSGSQTRSPLCLLFSSRYLSLGW
jgi:hypothetical protein